MIKKDSLVKFDFTLTVNGEVIDSSKGGKPIVYLHGAGQILPGLEKELEGMEKGEKKRIVLPPEKAFGEVREEAIQRIPLSTFPHPEDIPEKGTLQLEDEEGKIYTVKVLEKTKEFVTLDFNHPLAGKTLTFEVEILDIENLPG